jgi:hypothetical protein
LRHLVIGNLPTQSIRTQQDSVSWVEQELECIDLNIGLVSHTTCHHAAIHMDPSLFLSQHTCLDLFSHPRVIVRDLLGFTITDQVSTAIPYTGHCQPIITHSGSNYGRAHARLCLV